MKIYKLTVVGVISFCLCLLLSACQPALPRAVDDHNTQSLPDFPDGGRVSMFLSLVEVDIPLVILQVASIEILSDEIWIPLLATPVYFDSKKLAKGQIFLASRSIAPGAYSRMRITVNSAVKKDPAGRSVKMEVSNPLKEIIFKEPLVVTKENTKTIFLEFDGITSIDGNRLTDLDFTAKMEQSVPVTANLAYVSCPAQDTIYIIRTDKNWVTGAIAVSGGPTSLVADSDAKKLYVLTSKPAFIITIDLTTRNVLDEIRVPFASEPFYMTMSEDFKSAYLIDNSGSIIRINIDSGNMESRARIGQRPTYLIPLNAYDQLAVSSTLDQNLYLINATSLAIENTIRLGGPPQGLLVFDNLLYIAESISNNVSVYDLSNHQVLQRISVSADPYRFASVGQSLYVTNQERGEVSMLHGGQLYISKIIPVGDSVHEMAVAEMQRLLYVSTGGALGGVTVIDLTSNTVISKIGLGARPQGVVVVQ